MSGAVLIVRGLLPQQIVVELAAFLRCASSADYRGHFPLLIRLSPKFREIPRFLGAQPLLFDMLKTKKLYCHWPPMARCVEPGSSTALWDWHRDTKYNGHIEGDFLTVWVPLVPIDAECGGLTTEQGPLVPMELGDAVILPKDCLHASMPNTSDRPRLSCDYRFFGDDARSSKHFLDIAQNKVIEP